MLSLSALHSRRHPMLRRSSTPRQAESGRRPIAVERLRVPRRRCLCPALRCWPRSGFNPLLQLSKNDFSPRPLHPLQEALRFRMGIALEPAAEVDPDSDLDIEKQQP